MRTSLLKTLACKHHSTGRKMAAKYKAKIETPHGLRTCLQVTVERGEAGNHWSHGSAGYR